MESGVKTASSAVHWLCGALGITDLNKRIRERRADFRLAAEFPALISAGPCPSWVRGIDIDRRGAGVIAQEPVPVNTRVFIRFPEHRLMGFADVRHCSMIAPGSYRVGLRFSNGLERDSRGSACFKPTLPHPVPVWDEPAD